MTPMNTFKAKQLFCGLLATLVLAFAATANAGSDPVPAPAGTERAVTMTNELGAPDTTSVTGAYTGVSEYRIGPQDLLEINVFQVPDLTRTVRVNTGGQVSLPLIGEIHAGGRTVQEVEKQIAEKLAEGYLQNPQVSVFVKEFTSQRVTVEGAVKKPGIFPLSGRATLLQTIAMAEGLDPLADLQGIVIFRTVNGKKMAARFDLKQIRAGAAADPEVYGDDIVVVDQSGPKSTWRRVVESLPVLNLFRLF